MIRYIHADALNAFPLLKSTMLTDRATQFHDRLKWQVIVDENGFETDQYDVLNPLYVIWQRADGRHGGSMRFLPTTGRTMVNEHFGHLVQGGTISQNAIWETTRFCVSPSAAPADASRIAGLLMMAGAQLGVGLGLSHSVGVFDARMVRIYRKLGWEPEILGTDGVGKDAISAGLWKFTPEILNQMCRKASLSSELSRLWFNRAFGTVPKLAA